jgi:hypothetical protein
MAFGLPTARFLFRGSELHCCYVHRKQSHQNPLCTMRDAGRQLRVRQVLLSLPDYAGRSHLHGWADVLRALSVGMRLQNLGLIFP